MSTPNVGPLHTVVPATEPGGSSRASKGPDILGRLLRRQSPWGWRDTFAGAWRRRMGLAAVRVRFPRIHFGTLCDVRRPASFRVGRNAQVFFGDRCVLDHGFTLECSGTLSVGHDTIFGHHCTLAAAESVTIGNNCLIAELVSIRDHDHSFQMEDVPIRLQGQARAPVTIGSNVWLGAKVTVTSGVTIGDGAIVGANAVVTGDIPPYAVAVGIPAKVIRWRKAGAADHAAPNE